MLLGQRGQIAFFHGEIAYTGWWYYFPAAIFLKYPTGLLLAGVVGLTAIWKSDWSAPLKAAMTFPPFMILVSAMMQSINIGVRSVLPFAPFLAFWTGAAVWYFKAKWIRGILIALAATSVASGIAAYPNFLTYFNPMLGGAAAADKWLIDSNLDWGQDLPELSKELKRRGIPEIRLAYFGAGQPSYYDIKALDPDIIAPGWYAISRSSLSGWWPEGDPYDWLRELKPIALVGNSIALFKVDEQDLARIGKSTTKTDDEKSMSIGLDLLYNRNDYKGAAEQFLKVLAKNPGHYGATFQYAMALDRAGRTDEARLQWVKVLEMAKMYHDDSTAEIALKQLQKKP